MGIFSVVAMGVAIVASCAEATDGPRRLRIHMVRGVPDETLKQARQEVEALWRPHRITIEWVTTETNATPVPADLLVSFVDYRIGSSTIRERHAIAWILFHDGRPTHFIRVSRQAAVALLDSKPLWDGQATTPTHRDIRERALGRIIGRALAHEIGHYLLGSSAHASTGLMRASLPDTELVMPGRVRLRLAAADVRALRARRALSLQSTAASSGSSGSSASCGSASAAAPPRSTRCK